MNKEEIKYEKIENGYKVSMPLITDDELEKIDFNFHSIVDEYIKGFSNKREKTIEQRLIYDLQQENKQLKEEMQDLRNKAKIYLDISEEKEDLKEDIKVLFEENHNKEQIIIKQSEMIDKAIEYIENLQDDYKIYNDALNGDYIDLLGILKGEDNE